MVIDFLYLVSGEIMFIDVGKFLTELSVEEGTCEVKDIIIIRLLITRGRKDMLVH